MTDSDGPYGSVELALAEFSGVRSRLFGIAYRMLGSAAEADDVLQDVWLRWQAADRSEVVSAPHRELDRVGALVLLERLAPTERAAYVLREAFDYPHREIADILDLSEANSRQLVTRARRHLTDAGRRPVSSPEHRRLLQAFLAAAHHGDLPALEQAFAEDVVSWSDGGGKANAARTPVRGRARVARFIAAFASHFWERTDLTWIEANGRPAVVITGENTVKAVLAVDVSVDGIAALFWIMNPDKLAAFAR